MDYEEGNVKTLVDYPEGNNKDIEHFLWKNAGNAQDVDISVLKVGSEFYFFDNNAEAVSASPLNQGNILTIAGYDPTGAGLPLIYNYAFINGQMAVVSGRQSITFLSYDPDLDTVTAEGKTLSIRDTFGIFEDRAVDDRPKFNYAGGGGWASPSSTFIENEEASLHVYNLINQGWQDEIKHYSSNISDTTTLSTLVPCIGDTIASTTKEGGSGGFQVSLGINKMPSNADSLWSNLTGVFYNPQNLLNPLYGVRHASKGSVIFEDMFKRGGVRKQITESRTGRTSYNNLCQYNIYYPMVNLSFPEFQSLEETQGGLSAVTALGGRLIYSVYENRLVNRDNESPSFGDMLFFSQATDGTEGLTRCYTDLDPTEGPDFALLDTDGGYISLSGVGTINSLETLGNSIFVFANNGVWQINGGSSIFTASNINVHKITNIGNINRKGVVIASDRLFYLTDAGLFSIELNANDPSLPATVVNISQTTIQSIFDELSVTSKQRAVSKYDRYSNTVKWLFSSDALPDDGYFDTELILDLNLNAFYLNKFKTVDDISGEGTPYVVGYLERPSAIVVDTSSRIVVGGTSVVVNGEPVQITFRSIDSSILSSNKYWVASKRDETRLNFSVSEYKDLQFRDWGSVQNTVGSFGTDAASFLLTGYLVGGDSSSNKRVTYITSHFRRTERILSVTEDGFESDNPSSCTLTAQWEWTSSINAGRWSRPQEIYKLPRTFIPDVGEFDYGFEVVTTKNKLRGKGKALSLLFQTKPLHDCHLYGWSYEINSEQSV